MKDMTWKGDETGLLLVLYDEGFNLQEMADIINKKFGTDYSDKAVGGKLHRLREKYNLPKMKEVKRNKQPILPAKEEKIEVVEEIVPIVQAKVDKPPQQKSSVNKKKVNKMKKNTTGKRHSKKWTVAEDIVLISHYGRLPDDELVSHLGRSISGIQYRYRLISNDKAYVGNLVIAGLENANMSITPSGEIVVEKKPSFFKRWKKRRLTKRQAKAKAKIAKLNKALKGMEE